MWMVVVLPHFLDNFSRLPAGKENRPGMTRAGFTTAGRTRGLRAAR